jgi:hypothetical protein
MQHLVELKQQGLALVSHGLLHLVVQWLGKLAQPKI